MKNLLIIVLSFTLVILLYRNQKVLNRNINCTGVTTIQAQMARETPQPIQSPMPQLSITPKPSPFSVNALLRTQLNLEKLNLESLQTDIVDLKQQIKNAAPKVIDEEIKNTMSEISTLQSQYNYYHTAQAAANQTASQQLHYIETLNRQMQTYLSSQLEAADRELQSALQNLMYVSLNSNFNSYDKIAEMQIRIQTLETQLNSLQAQKTQNASDTYAQISQIKNQGSTNESNTNYIQSALQAQILTLQNTINRLQGERGQSQTILTSLNRELADRMQSLKEIQIRIDQLISQIP